MTPEIDNHSLLTRLAGRRAATIGLSIVVMVHVLALISPWISPHDPGAIGHLTEDRFLRPSWDHPLGTDRLSRDVLSRLLHAGQVSLIVGSVSVLVSVAIGTAWPPSRATRT